MVKFIGRQRELSILEKVHTSSQSALVVLYGRRRIGKTSLVTQFCKGKKYLYFACRQINDEMQRAEISRQLIRMGAPLGKFVSVFDSWDTIFNQLGEISGKEKLVCVIDEFPYAVEGNSSIPSVLQHAWDQFLSQKNIMLILCGSSMSFMEKEVLAEKSPLFGRATHTIKLTEMSFHETVEFFPHYSAVDQVLSYAVLGGSPYCLNCFNPDISFEENVINTILMPSGRLWDYPNTIIHQECREPARYNEILTAIAMGATRFSDLVSKTTISSSNLPRFLRNLEEMGFVSREFSILTPIKQKAIAQRGLYRLSDPFVSFWYRYVWSNYDLLSLGGATIVFNEQLKPQMNEMASRPFEDICKQFLWEKNLRSELPFTIQKLGRWWIANEEIDLVGSSFDGQNLLLAECKFKNSAVSKSEYFKLKEKAKVFSSVKKYFVLFSKSGFTEDLIELAKDRESNLQLIGLDEMVKLK